MQWRKFAIQRIRIAFADVKVEPIIVLWENSLTLLIEGFHRCCTNWKSPWFNYSCVCLRTIMHTPICILWLILICLVCTQNVQRVGPFLNNDLVCLLQMLPEWWKGIFRVNHLYGMLLDIIASEIHCSNHPLIGWFGASPASE